MAWHVFEKRQCSQSAIRPEGMWHQQADLNTEIRESHYLELVTASLVASTKSASSLTLFQLPRSQRQVNKQAVRHMSVSVLRAVPTTRLKDGNLYVRLFTKVNDNPDLNSTRKACYFHFEATYHHRCIASPEGNTNSEISAPCQPYFSILDSKHKHTFLCPSIVWGRCFWKHVRANVPHWLQA